VSKLLLRTPAAVTPEKQRLQKRGASGLRGGIRSFSCPRQYGREANPGGRPELRQISHRDFVRRTDDQAAKPTQSAGIAAHFPDSAVVVFVHLRQRPERTTAMTDQFAVDYEGTEPFPDAGRPPRTVEGAVRVGVTAAIVIVPFVGLGVAVWFAWGHGLHLTEVLLATAFYLVTGLGVTIGFHRLLTHRSFTAAPALRVVLAIAGSMSFEGEVIGWVAIHRRHHAFTDRPGDPHSPYRYGTHLAGQLRGLGHAHIGWLLRDDPTPAARYAPDLAADPAMRAISAAFPGLCAVSLGLPFAAGWAIGGSWHAALAALLWAGLVRVTLLQHITWSVNSLCHMIGTRPFTTRRHDRATNLWPLALLSLGESWHNMHHSDPSCARHGADPWQIDISAAVIRIFERLGWATGVHWPAPTRLDRHRAIPAS
jgi:stearoyl-CoA desaturase (delta-9 desaturase)